MQVSLSSWSGYYSWCGTEGKYEIGGDKLETMIECTVLVDPVLFKRAENLEVYMIDKDGKDDGCCHYPKIFTNPYIGTFSMYMNPEIKKLSFRLVKYHHTPGASPLARPRREFFNQIEVSIPSIEAVEDKTCTICLAPAETGFITRCHHIFHKECLLSYLDQFTRKERCSNHCHHGGNKGLWKCPNCRTIC